MMSMVYNKLMGNNLFHHICKNFVEDVNASGHDKSLTRGLEVSKGMIYVKYI